MAKYALRIQARELRGKGESVKSIAKKLNVSKSSVSIWVRDIILSIEQLEKIKQIELKGAERGRIKSAFLQKEKRLLLIEKSNKEGIKEVGTLVDREFLMSGLALYWGEGSKKGRRVEFCNSDPKMIQFVLLWLKKFFAIDASEITCYLGVNESHRLRENTIKEYWSKYTGIPLNQFNKTSFKKVMNKKIYENFNDHYGTLSIRVHRPARIYYKIMGLIEGLKYSMAG